MGYRCHPQEDYGTDVYASQVREASYKPPVDTALQCSWNKTETAPAERLVSIMPSAECAPTNDGAGTRGEGEESRAGLA